MSGSLIADTQTASSSAFAEPDSGDVHVPRPPGGDDDERPTRAFLRRLKDLLRQRVKDGDLSDADYSECVARARGHAGGVMRARKRAETMAGGEDEPHTSCIVALWLPDADAQALALAGGEPAEDLHITLCHLGRSTPELAAKVRTIVGSFAMHAAPVAGSISGLGRFNASESSDGLDCVHALVDAPTLPAFRQALVTSLVAAGCMVSTDHGFTPHVTLAYLAPGQPAPVEQVASRPVTFGEVWVCAGEERTAYALLGPELMPAEIDAALRYGEPRDFAEALAAGAFAEPTEWVPYLPKPGRYTHPRYGEIVLTPERIGRFVAQFNAGVYQSRVPLDAEHETKLSGACGWLTALRQNADGSADARVEWTDRGRSLLAADRFGYISPEFYDEWREPASGQVYQDIAIGGALTTRPFFKEQHLRPLAATEDAGPDRTAGAPPEKGTTMSMTLTDEQAKDFAEQAKRLAELEATLAKQATELEATKQAREQAETAAKALSDRLDRQEKAARTRRFTDEVLGKSDASSIRWFGEPDKHVAMLEKLAGAFGEDSAEVRAYIEQNRAVGEAMKQSDLFKEVGRTGSGPADTSAEAEIARRARAMTEADPKLSMAEATTRVLDADHALQDRYLNERKAR